MHAEELKHKPPGTLVGVLITLGLVFGILGAVFVVDFLQYWLGVYWIQFILYGLVVLLAFVIVKKKITEYIYLIEKDRITFGRRIGKREKELLFVPFREIIDFGSRESMAGKIEGKKRRKYTFKKKEDWYVINCARCAVILSPTPAYIECLRAVKSGRKKKDENADT